MTIHNLKTVTLLQFQFCKICSWSSGQLGSPSEKVVVSPSSGLGGLIWIFFSLFRKIAWKKETHWTFTWMWAFSRKDTHECPSFLEKINNVLNFCLFVCLFFVLFWNFIWPHPDTVVSVDLWTQNAIYLGTLEFVLNTFWFLSCTFYICVLQMYLTRFTVFKQTVENKIGGLYGSHCKLKLFLSGDESSPAIYKLTHLRTQR